MNTSTNPGVAGNKPSCETKSKVCDTVAKYHYTMYSFFTNFYRLFARFPDKFCMSFEPEFLVSLLIVFFTFFSDMLTPHNYT